MHSTLDQIDLPEICRSSWKWRLIGTAFSPDVLPVSNRRHREWMLANSHQHAHPEILFILRGKGYHGLNHAIYPLDPGTVLIINSLEVHDNFVPEWAPDADHLWIMLVHDHFIVRRLSVRDGAANVPSAWSMMLAQDEVGMLPQRSLADVQVDSALPAEFRRMRAFAVVAGVIAAVAARHVATPVPPDRESFHERIVATVRRHIEETAGNGVNLDSLSHISGYSKFHFLRLFKQYTGYSVHDYIDECRLQRVHELEFVGHSKTDIAHALGFSCPSAFSRWYRQQRERE